MTPKPVSNWPGPGSNPGPYLFKIQPMGWLTSQFYPGIKYKELERFTKDEARARTFANTIARQRKELEDRERLSALSQANKSHLQRLKEFELEFGDRLRSRRSIVESYTSTSRPIRMLKAREVLRLLEAKSEYLNLRSRYAALRKSARNEQRAAFLRQASAADRRYWSPITGFFRNPRDTLGREAKSFVNSFGKRQFITAAYAVPCVRRAVRREVMFAKQKAGRGYRVKHRLNQLSNFWC